MFFYYFIIISPWKRGTNFSEKLKKHLNKLGSPLDQYGFTNECIVQSSVEIGTVVLEKKIFKFCQCNFAIS